MTEHGMKPHSYDPDSHVPGNSCTYCGRSQDDPLHAARGEGFTPRRRQEHDMTDYTGDFEEMAGIIHFRVGAWQDFGYEQPPTPECAAIPPLGKRSANAVKAGHGAVQDIDRLIARLHQVRARLISEMRQDQEIRMAVPVEKYEHETEWDSADSNAYQDRVEAGLEPEDGDGL